MLVDSSHFVHPLVLPLFESSLEQTAASVLSSLGPVIAIGRPGESLPPPGAARLWLSNEEWRSRVSELLSRCVRVVMILGDIKGEDGLAWEVDAIFRLTEPAKVILIVPPVPENAVRTRWEKYRARSYGRLPPYQGRETIVAFGPNWEPYMPRGQWWLADRRDKEDYASLLRDVIAPRLPGRAAAPARTLTATALSNKTLTARRSRAQTSQIKPRRGVPDMTNSRGGPSFRFPNVPIVVCACYRCLTGLVHPAESIGSRSWIRRGARRQFE